MINPIKYENKEVMLLDQTLLPEQSVYVAIETVEQMFDAIRTMKVRGAPAIGIAAAYGMVIAAKAAPTCSYGAFMAVLHQHGEYLSTSRPTAVNLSWAISRMTDKAQSLQGSGIEEIIAELERQAILIHEEDGQINRAIGENLLSLLEDGNTVLTHCNAGILATSKYGTATSPFYLAKEKGMNIKVYADETRPRFQGARLTAYELSHSGVDVTLICDNMAAMVMKSGKIDAVIVGCDRVAANGDTANKIGTLNVAILAKHFGIPMYIAAPTPTIDMACERGEDIPIEERDRLEVVQRNGFYTAPKDVKVFNPAFDVTPNELISAIVTEKGIVRPPFGENLKKLF